MDSIILITQLMCEQGVSLLKLGEAIARTEFARHRCGPLHGPVPGPTQHPEFNRPSPKTGNVGGFLFDSSPWPRFHDLGRSRADKVTTRRWAAGKKKKGASISGGVIIKKAVARVSWPVFAAQSNLDPVVNRAILKAGRITGIFDIKGKGQRNRLPPGFFHWEQRPFQKQKPLSPADLRAETARENRRSLRHLFRREFPDDRARDKLLGGPGDIRHESEHDELSAVRRISGGMWGSGEKMQRRSRKLRNSR